MANAPAQRDTLAETFSENRKVLVPYLAELLKRSRIVTLDSKEIKDRFWQRAASEQQEAQLWRDGFARLGTFEPDPKALLALSLEISQQVYPARWDMMRAEGRTSPAEQADWAWSIARHGPPEPEGTSQPAPEPAPAPAPASVPDSPQPPTPPEAPPSEPPSPEAP